MVSSTVTARPNIDFFMMNHPKDIRTRRLVILQIPKKNLSQDFRKNDLQKEVKRRTVFVDPYPQRSALPCIDNKCRECFGRKIFGDGVGSLRLADHERNLIGPRGKRRGDLFPNQWTLIGQLASEVTQQAPGPGLGRAFTQAFEMPSQSGQRRRLRVPQCPQRFPRLALLPVLEHCLCAKRFLAIEMVVERALWNTRRFGNVLDTGGVEAPAPQGLETCREELFANVGSSHDINVTGRLRFVKRVLTIERRGGKLVSNQWGGRWDSNPQQPESQSGTLPLSYVHRGRTSMACPTGLEPVTLSLEG